MTSSMNWLDFSKLVETAIRAEKCLAEEEGKSLKRKNTNSKVS